MQAKHTLRAVSILLAMHSDAPNLLRLAFISNALFDAPLYSALARHFDTRIVMCSPIRTTRALIV